METKDVIFQLRTQKGLSQDELAEKVYVTRQAVSRWENGETTPNTETLKLLSKLFDVSINTLLCSPRHLICQCCGMPLEDGNISKESDGSFNENYCKWCYANGKYTYDSMDDLIEFCASHMANGDFTSAHVRSYMKDLLPGLDYWKQYAALGGEEPFQSFQKQIMEEFNRLQIEGMSEVTRLDVVSGSFIRSEFRLPTGQLVPFLNEGAAYLGTQLESEFGGDRRFALAAGMDFLLVCTHDKNGADPELVLYKKR